jgi:hypothetical protein
MRRSQVVDEELSAEEAAEEAAEEEVQRWQDPGPEVTRKSYRRWSKAVRGGETAEDMTNPVWEWMFRGRIDPYLSSRRFRGLWAKLRRATDFPQEPRWAGCRMGQSRTPLSDGRVVWVAGEHEDFYDPDFFIYNDVIVEHADGRLQILGYPVRDFVPTDFHSATAVEEETALLIIGSLGYPDDRRENETQVYRLDTASFEICSVKTSGNAPGWIHKHAASLSDDGQQILVRGGEILTVDGFVENIDDWSLSVTDLRWTRETQRQWIRFYVSRCDEEALHLWAYSMVSSRIEYPQLDSAPLPFDLAADLGGEPNMDAYLSLYQPAIPHQAVEGDVECDNDWRTTRIMLDGVCVRFVDDLYRLCVTVEGKLPQETLEALSAELTRKLGLVERAPCEVKWLEVKNK